MRRKVDAARSLKEISKKIVMPGEDLPLVRLKDGSRVQTGTVATVLHNIKLYNQGERSCIEQEVEAAVPTLIRVGLFELFSPDEWIAGGNAGRTLIGQKAKEILSRESCPPRND